MRSYREHLETLLAPQTKPLTRRPTFRSSAIFPVILSEGVQCRLLFLGYWALKREIQEVTLVATLRNQEGTPLHRHVEPIREPKAYRFELAHMLPENQTNFEGSIEVEFFSGQDLVFPYPAVVINYYGKHFSTVVHTAQRVYNDHEDHRINSQTCVPEAGFNLYSDSNSEPFLALVNGPQEVTAQTIAISVYNSAKKEMQIPIRLEKLKPYETVVIYPNRHRDLEDFLDGQPGTAKIHFQAAWIYPRLLVGNKHRNTPGLSITHTYYDCTGANKENDYWFETDPDWHDAALMVPTKVDTEHFTRVYFYPIYSPSQMDIDVEIYDTQGECLGRSKNVQRLDSPGATFGRIDLKAICQQLQINCAQPLTTRVLARRAIGSHFPARIKLGLDLGKSSDGFPCNICTNLHPFNPSLENKPHCFRWLPIFDQGSVWLINSSPSKDYMRQAVVQVTFYRECDTEKLERSLTLAPHGFAVLEPTQDKQLADFLQGSIGWCTATSSNPYLSTYYFVEDPSGTVGGDHGF